MHSISRSLLATIAAAASPFLSPVSASADEGMWLLNQPPLDALEERYGFRPDPAWLERMQKSAVRFENGGSGSIISADGLVLTNHHVGSDVIEKLSTPQRNLLRDGYLARTRAEELPCEDLELRALWSIEDVTDRVNAAAEGLAPAEGFAARQREMARIEKESQDATGLVSQVVTLDQGGRYHLYRSKSFTDVRLVFAPELAIAFFGGDPDNFEYPRHCLDMALFRIYENGEPLRAEHFLETNPDGASDGELTFVFGHPGRTQRQLTADHLRFLRDVEAPMVLNLLARREVATTAFAGRSPEAARRAEGDLFGIANSRKARTGMLDTLQDPAFIAGKRDADSALRRRIAADAEARDAAAGADALIVASLRDTDDLLARHAVLEQARGAGDLFRIARTLVRLAAESEKPNDERLPPFRDSNRAALELELYSPAPIHEDLEALRLSLWLARIVEVFGGDHPIVATALAGESPSARAHALIKTRLGDVETRRRVAGAGPAAIRAARDPLLILARDLDAESRRLRKLHEDEVLGPQRDAYGRLARARFIVDGESSYPDATFTLRMSFGPIRGYEEEGRAVAPFTTIAEVFTRADERGDAFPFALPPSWRERKERIDGSTPFNFVSTADIIGGNSGSPVVDQDGRLVGLIFDGNIHSLAWDYAFDDRQGRAISVDVRAMLEALRDVYDAQHLADEMLGAATPPPAPATNDPAPRGTAR
ncbi:MAG TPA: S46 family peptidase [Phycisphaerales bacterium]|nr:S46 family peptidase [Phycisphaerales bacterium]HMP36391.1 S46 family peptidase [Phycisphaerales bacterium]